MMQSTLISVVIPVYKVEKYLDRCIASVVNQTYENLEIILVDDGSPDACPAMCDAWAKRDNRIRVIHKENAGLGMARNTGIESASGEFICFIDSDDFILPNMIEQAVGVAKKENADITIYGFIIVDGAGKETKIIPQPRQRNYSGEEVRNIFLPEYIGVDPKTGKDSGIPGSACTCLISMELVRHSNWHFVSERDILSEDVYSFLVLCKEVKKVVVLNKSLYCYCTNDVSLTHTFHRDRFEKNKYCYQKCVELCQELNYPEEVQNRCTELLVGGTISAMKQDVAYYKEKEKALQRIRQIVNDELLQQVLLKKKRDKTKLKKKIFLWAVRHKMYVMVYLLLYAQNAVTK